MTNLEQIKENFSYLDDWEDRYRYVIELGKELTPLEDEQKTEANRVEGCVSQVWLVVEPQKDGRLILHADSDAHIVKGLVAIALAIYSGHTATAITKTDGLSTISQLGLTEYLTPQRANGLRALINRIHRVAESMSALT